MADSLQRLGLNQLNHKLKVRRGGIEVTKKYVVYVTDPQSEIIEQHKQMFGKISTPTKKLIV